VSFRITVTPNGQVITECDSAAETAALVRELKDGKAPKKRKRAAPPKALEIESVDIPLSPVLVETWNYLVKHDAPDGVHTNEVAAGLGIKVATANYRLTALLDKELAHKPSPGHWRAGG
jgi:hypothetical protein